LTEPNGIREKTAFMYYTFYPERPVDEINFLGLLMEKKLLKSLSVSKNNLSVIDVDMTIEEVREFADSIDNCHMISQTLTVFDRPDLKREDLYRMWLYGDAG